MIAPTIFRGIMAAPAYVNQTAMQFNGGATSVNVDMPPSRVSGNLVCINLSTTATAGQITPPSGWDCRSSAGQVDEHPGRRHGVGSCWRGGWPLHGFGCPIVHVHEQWCRVRHTEGVPVFRGHCHRQPHRRMGHRLRRRVGHHRGCRCHHHRCRLPAALGQQCGLPTTPCTTMPTGFTQTSNSDFNSGRLPAWKVQASAGASGTVQATRGGVASDGSQLYAIKPVSTGPTTNATLATTATLAGGATLARVSASSLAITATLSTGVPGRLATARIVDHRDTRIDGNPWRVTNAALPLTATLAATGTKGRPAAAALPRHHAH